MDRVAREYFHPYPFVLNRQVYVQHDKDAMEFNDAWHLDPSCCLKFFLYLNDTSAANGAMMYVPGSHREGYFRIMFYKMQGIEQFPQRIPDDEVPPHAISCEAEAGSLLVFQSGAIHRGGIMQVGKERLVIRGHTYPMVNWIPSRIQRLLLRSPLNLARYRMCADDRFNPTYKSAAQVWE